MSEEEQFLERTVKIKNLKQGIVLLEFEPNNEQVGSPYYNMQHEQYSFEVNSLAINRRIAQHREKNTRKDVHDYFTIDSENITAKLKPTGGTRLYSMFGTERIIEDISFVLSKSEELEHCRLSGWHKTDYGGWGPETEDHLQFKVFLNEKRYDSIVSGINQNIEPKKSFNVHGVRGFYGESREIDTGLVQYVGTRNPDSVKVLCDEEHLGRIVRDPSRKNKGLEFATLGETNEFDLSLDFSPDTHAKTDEETKRDGTKIHELNEQILILEDKNKNFSAEIKTLQEKLEKIEEQFEQDEESARENIKKTKSLRDAVSDNFPLIFKIALGVIFLNLYYL